MTMRHEKTVMICSDRRLYLARPSVPYIVSGAAYSSDGEVKKETMHKPKSLLIAAVGWGLVIAGLLACGGSATPVATEAPATQASGGSPLDSLDPCTLLTQDDATAFFGAPAAAGKPSHGSTTAICLYQTADSQGLLSLLLEYNGQGALQADDYVQQKGSTAQEVPGLGDGAYFDPQVHLLTVAKGPWMVRVNGYVQAANAPLEKLTPLAQTVLGRLP